MVLRTAPHEFDVQINFNEGLTPYFGAHRRINETEGKATGSFAAEGEEWTVMLSYQDSGIVHPGDETPNGTPFEIEKIREYRLKVEAKDDVGEKKFTAHIRPRWQGMKARRKYGSTVSIPLPPAFDEGVNVRIQGSNIEFEHYHELLLHALETVGLNSRYYREVFDSTIMDAERYHRILTTASGPIHARDGPIWALGHLLESDRSGYRKIVQNDDTNQGKNQPGYYHTVTLGPKRISEAWPDHSIPKEIKHYYSREPQDRDPDTDPLAHPKLGASYQASRWDESIGLEDLDRLNRELEEAVLSVEQDAGIDISPSEPDEGNDEGPLEKRGAFVDDAYFDLELVEREPPTAIDITEVKQEQESIFVKHFVDNGISPVEEEALQTLLTDGGTVSPKNIADENDRHLGSVYRALQRIDGLVERKYGEVSLRSEFVADKIWSALQESREGLKKATRTAAKAEEMAERQVGEAMEKFVAWAERHGVDYRRDLADRMEIELPEDTNTRGHLYGSAGHKIRVAYDLWTQAGQDPDRFRRALVKVGQLQFSAHRALG